MIHKQTVYKRLQRGWDYESARNTPALKKPGEYLTSQQINIAKQNGISYITAYSRVKRGWSVERAITERPKRRTR